MAVISNGTIARKRQHYRKTTRSSILLSNVGFLYSRFINAACFELWPCARLVLPQQSQRKMSPLALRQVLKNNSVHCHCMQFNCTLRYLHAPCHHHHKVRRSQTELLNRWLEGGVITFRAELILPAIQTTKVDLPFSPFSNVVVEEPEPKGRSHSTKVDGFLNHRPSVAHFQTTTRYQPT